MDKLKQFKGKLIPIKTEDDIETLCKKLLYEYYPKEYKTEEYLFTNNKAALQQISQTYEGQTFFITEDSVYKVEIEPEQEYYKTTENKDGSLSFELVGEISTSLPSFTEALKKAIKNCKPFCPTITPQKLNEEWTGYLKERFKHDNVFEGWLEGNRPPIDSKICVSKEELERLAPIIKKELLDSPEIIKNIGESFIGTKGMPTYLKDILSKLLRKHRIYSTVLILGCTYSGDTREVYFNDGYGSTKIKIPIITFKLTRVVDSITVE